MSDLPPPPLGPQWSNWGERLNQFLIRTRDKLRFIAGGETASDNGVMLWNEPIDHVVVSRDGEFIPLMWGYNAYGMFYDTTTQTASATNTATAVTWNNTAYSNYITIDGTDTSKIVFSKAGVYEVHFSGEMHSENASAKDMYIWPRINGVDVSGSTMVNTIETNDHRKTVSRSGLFEVSANDYLQAMFAVTDTDLDFHGLAATAFAPATPSVTIMLKEVTA
jgi:hypothetical protein